MTYIQREIEAKIKGYLDVPEILAIVGPRQAGKTTVVKHILEHIPNTKSYTFENPTLAKEFISAPDAFYERYIKGYAIVFFDEFQYVKNGGKTLKYIFDQYQGTKIIVSGSSAPDIAIQSLKYLVGRVFIIEVFPLSLKEFITFKDGRLGAMLFEEKSDISAFFGDLQKYTEEYIRFGGYPRVVLAPQEEEKKEILSNIYSTLFLREVKDIAGLVETDKLELLMKSISLIMGSVVEYKTLSEITGYTFLSIKKYIKLLRDAYIIIYVSPYFNNKLKEITKSPKIYYLDSGLRNFIVQDFRPLTLRTDAGALFEQLFLKALGAPTQDIHYWRDKKGNEIDFVRLEEALIPHGYECKLTFRQFSAQTESAFLALHPQGKIHIGALYGGGGKSGVAPWQV